MTTVWTQEADARLRDYLASHELVAGIGTEESTCSVAAINCERQGRKGGHAMTTPLYCEVSDCRSSTSKLFSCAECRRFVCEGCWQGGHHEGRYL